MNLYESILLAAQLRRNDQAVENEVGRQNRRESFLASVPKAAGDSNVLDLDDFRTKPLT